MSMKCSRFTWARTIVLLNLSVDFKDELDAGDIEKTIEKLTRDIRLAHPDIKRVFVEAEDSSQ